MSEPSAPPDHAALRAEHDALATRLEARASIQVARVGLYQIFAGLLATGASVALAWDRWGPLKPGVARVVAKGPPVFLYVAVAAAVLLLAVALRSFVRARRFMREEERLYARFRALRDALGLES